MIINNHKFQNLKPIDKKIYNFWNMLKWKLFTKNKKFWPMQKQLVDDNLKPEMQVFEDLHVTNVGHVTFLIQICGYNILTDPVWSERVSPFTFFGPKRIQDPGVKIENLPPIDLILISHNHYDHLDIQTLKKLHQFCKPTIIVPLENGKIITKHIPNANIIELNWYEDITFTSNNQSLKIYLEPAQHWSARSLWDKNKALWGTFIIETHFRDSLQQICFIGDSGYDADLFKNIGKKHKNIYLSLIPIGAYTPRKFMQDVHMDPYEAILTFLDLKTKYAIASHYDVFPLADDSFGQAPKDLMDNLEKLNISSNQFLTPYIGQRIIF